MNLIIKGGGYKGRLYIIFYDGSGLQIPMLRQFGSPAESLEITLRKSSRRAKEVIRVMYKFSKMQGEKI